MAKPIVSQSVESNADKLHPLIKLLEYPFVICTVRQYGCMANEVQTSPGHRPKDMQAAYIQYEIHRHHYAQPGEVTAVRITACVG